MPNEHTEKGNAHTGAPTGQTVEQKVAQLKKDVGQLKAAGAAQAGTEQEVEQLKKDVDQLKKTGAANVEKDVDQLNKEVEQLKATGATQAEALEEIPQADRDAILREAVSCYLRSDFRDARIRRVCEEYIAAADKTARAAVAQTGATHAPQAHGVQPETHQTPPPERPKK